MSVDFRSSERHRYVNDFQAREKEIAAVLKVSSPSSPKDQQQLCDKRVRREIANGNERRRMQCINAGFTSLRALIPHLEGEKLSKAAILQQSIDYIASLEKDKSRLQMQLERTTRLLAELGQQDRVLVDSFVANTPPPSKRKKRDTESSDEGVGSLSDASDDCGSADLRQKNDALRHQMDREKQRGDSLEEENRSLRNLIFLIQKNAREPQNSVAMVTASSQPQETRVRDVVELMSPRLNYTPPLHQDEVMEYSIATARPSSLTPDSTITMAATATSVNVGRIGEPVSISSDTHMDHRDTPSAGYQSAASPSLISMSSPGLTTDNVITSTNAVTNRMPQQAAAAVSSDSSVLHNYAHRDHPRRRRHQAQLERERIEEEERRQKEQEERQLQLQQQQQQQSLSTSTYIPRSSVHSLDILAEAANHVKDERIDPLFENEKTFQISQPVVYQISEDTAARLGIQHEFIISDNERLSPPSSTILTSTSASLHQPILQHHNVNVSSHIPIIVTTAATSENSNLDRSSSFSEKYPIASHLLHRPLHTPFTRPGVIVQKH